MSRSAAMSGSATLTAEMSRMTMSWATQSTISSGSCDKPLFGSRGRVWRRCMGTPIPSLDADVWIMKSDTRVGVSRATPTSCRRAREGSRVDLAFVLELEEQAVAALSRERRLERRAVAGRVDVEEGQVALAQGDEVPSGAQVGLRLDLAAVARDGELEFVIVVRLEADFVAVRTGDRAR